jgi:hypothetical protein
MKNKILPLLVLACLVLASYQLQSQSVIVTDDATYTTPAAGALLDVHSQNGDMGILIPTTTAPGSISTAAGGLLVFNTTDNSYYFYNGTSWTKLCGSSGISATYGEMYENTVGGTHSTISSGTWNPWITATNNASHMGGGMSFVDDNTNGDYIQIPSDGAGTYKIDCTGTVDAGNNKVIEVGVFVNTGASPESNMHSELESVDGGITFALTGILVLSANDQLRLKFSPGTSMDIYAINFNVIRLD